LCFLVHYLYGHVRVGSMLGTGERGVANRYGYRQIQWFHRFLKLAGQSILGSGTWKDYIDDKFHWTDTCMEHLEMVLLWCQ